MNNLILIEPKWKNRVICNTTKKAILNFFYQSKIEIDLLAVLALLVLSLCGWSHFIGIFPPLYFINLPSFLFYVFYSILRVLKHLIKKFHGFKKTCAYGIKIDIK